MGLSVVLVEDVGGNVGGVVGENHFGKRRCGELEQDEYDEKQDPGGRLTFLEGLGDEEKGYVGRWRREVCCFIADHNRRSIRVESQDSAGANHSPGSGTGRYCPTAWAPFVVARTYTPRIPAPVHPLRTEQTQHPALLLSHAQSSISGSCARRIHRSSRLVRRLPVDQSGFRLPIGARVLLVRS